MNNNTSNNLKVPESEIFAIGQNIVVILDKKLVQGLKISEENILVQQQLTEEGILLKPIRRHGQ
jgi:hypothetical protein